MTVTIQLNGELRDVAPERSLDQCLADWGYVDAPVAVAVNGAFVPRSTYGAHVLRAGDCVEVLAPVEGG